MLPSGFSIRSLEPIDYIKVHDLVAKTPFLARKSWGRPLADIALDGITCGSWMPLGIFHGEDLVSYVDYKLKENRVEIGISVTEEMYRRQGYASILMRYLFDEYSDKYFVTMCAVQNRPQMTLLSHLGFVLEHYTLADRIDGTDTAIMVRPQEKE